MIVDAVAQSFFKSLRPGISNVFYTKNQAKKETFEYVEFYYNRVRSHSYLGKLLPSKFEEINLVLQLNTDA